MLAVVSQADIILFALFLMVAFLLMIGLFFFTAWMHKHHQGVSPYTGMPLRRASDIPYASAEKILRFLYELHQYDNRIFQLSRAAVCRETGRIFPNCITIFGTVRVDWDFLKKRFPGHYVSWGSLTDAQRELIIANHDLIEGFQTSESSPHPSPSAIDSQYAFTKPGPLYVDLNTKVLLGWKKVPGTLFEVLILQRPRKPYNY
jgi:hypothetical protein